MRRQERILRIQKVKMFSQKQAELLSGFSRDQLRKLDTAGILTPYKVPSILYSWNQLIFLKILYYLREFWTFKQIENALKNSDKPIDIEFIIENIQKADSVYFGEHGKNSHHEVKVYIEFNSFHIPNIFDRKKFHDRMENFEWIIKDIGQLNKFKYTPVNVPKLIKELKLLASELEIQDFELKVG